MTTAKDEGVPYISRIDPESPFFHRRHGVFYPTGHVVLAYDGPEALARAWKDAWRDEVGWTGVRALRADQMIELATQSAEHATIAAKIVSAELKQIDVLRQMAEQGAEFLIVADASLAEDRRQTLLERCPPAKATHYGTITMVEVAKGRKDKVADSPFGMNEQRRDGG